MTIWYIARGAGLSALVLLTVATCLGALVSRHSARTANAGRRYVMQYVHRVAASLGLTVLVLHIAMILADSYAHVGWLAALIPFTSAYRPVWVGIGSLAAYTFVFAAVLGLARGRLASSARAARVWRTLHGLAYVGWGAAMLHGFNSGTDTTQNWVRALYLVALIAVVGSVTARLLQARPAGVRRFDASTRTGPAPTSQPRRFEGAVR